MHENLLLSRHLKSMGTDILLKKSGHFWDRYFICIAWAEFMKIYFSHFEFLNSVTEGIH
jgi:hypothetical protein